MQFMERFQRRRRWLLLSLLLVPALLGALATRFYVQHQPPLYEASGLVRLQSNSISFGPTRRLGKRAIGDEIALFGTDKFRQALLEQLTPRQRLKLAHARKWRGGARKNKSDNAIVGPASLNLTIEREPFTPLLRLTVRDADPVQAVALVNAAIAASVTVGEQVAVEHAAEVRRYYAPMMAALKPDLGSLASQARALSIMPGKNRQKPVGPADAAGQPSDFSQPLNPATRRFKSAGSHAADMASFRFGESGQGDTYRVLRSAQLAASLAARQDEARVDLLRAGASNLPGDSGGAEQGAGSGPNAGSGAANSSNQAGAGQAGTGQAGAGQASLLVKLDRAKADYQALAQTLGPRNPAMLRQAAYLLQLRQQQADAHRRELAAARFQAAADRAQAASLARAASQEQRRLLDLRAQDQGSALAEIDDVIKLTLYEDIKQRLAELPLVSRLSPPVVEVVDSPTLPVEPVPVPARTAMRNGLYTGLALGWGAMVLVVLLTSSRWDTARLEEETGRPVLAAVPLFSGPHASHTGPSGPEHAFTLPQRMAEHLMAAQDAVDRFLPRESLVLVFTSALPGEGKTALATAMAATLARQGHRTLLIEANADRPALARRFGLDSRQGLSRVLAGRVALAQAVQPVGSQNCLHVLPLGPPPPRASDLLSDQAMNDLLTEARQCYRFILLDLASTQSIPPVSFQRQADVVFLVSRYGWVRPRSVRHGAHRLERAGLPISALLINAVPTRTSTWLELMTRLARQTRARYAG